MKRALAATVLVMATASAGRADPAPAAPFVAYEHGLGEAVAPTFTLAIASDGAVEVTDRACAASTPVHARLTARELAAVRAQVAAAHLSALQPSYLPRGESDDVGAAALRLGVTERGTTITRAFDDRHAPAALVALGHALDALVTAHHWLRAAGGAGCWCTQMANEHRRHPACE